MKINPDALAKLAALQATQGVGPLGGEHAKGSAAQTVVGAVPPPVGVTPAGAAGRLQPRAPVVGTPLTLSVAARQLSATPPPATLQWAHEVIETLTGLKLPPPLPRTPRLPVATGPAAAPFVPAGAMPATPSPGLPVELPPGNMAAPDSALFTAQGQVFTDDHHEVAFSLQLFADRPADNPHAPPVISNVLARMLASHPPMPPIALRFSGSTEGLRSAVFEFQLEPSIATTAASPAGPSAAATPAPTGVRLLGLLVLDPQMDAVYDMHVAMHVEPKPDPASILAAMGFQQGKPPVGKGVWDSGADRLLCDDHRCPHFGDATCPQPHCLRHSTTPHPGAAP